MNVVVSMDTPRDWGGWSGDRESDGDREVEDLWRGSERVGNMTILRIA